jgi:hypothetical protein
MLGVERFGPFDIRRDAALRFEREIDQDRAQEKLEKKRGSRFRSVSVVVLADSRCKT